MAAGRHSAMAEAEMVAEATPERADWEIASPRKCGLVLRRDSTARTAFAWT